MSRLFLGRLSSVPATSRIERSVLHKRLESAVARPICLVRAGPGWGKTAALAEWVARGDGSARTHDASQEDVRSLVCRLLELRSADASSIGDVFGTGESYDELVLLLDGAEELFSTGELVPLVEELCHHRPEWLRIVLTSRHEPPFSVHRLRGQGAASDIDAAHLGFTVDEVRELLVTTAGVESLGLAAWIRESTGGWPAAVRTVVETLRDVAPSQQHEAVNELTRPGGRLWAYLSEEVFASEPETVRTLLRRMAILGQVTRPLCDALGFGTAGALLPDLSRRGIVRFDAASGGTWSLIPVVRDFIEGDHAAAPDGRADLHSRAAEFFAQRGNHGRALHHLAEAGNEPAVESLLVERGTTLVDTGQADAVLSAAESLPAAGSNPVLEHVVGYARQVRGQWARALESFRHAAAGSDALEPALAWRMGQLPYLRGEFQRALAVYRRASLQREDTRDEALLLAWNASAHRMIGNTEECSRLTARAVAAAQRCGDPSAWASVCTVQAMLSASAGDRVGTDAYFRAGLQWAQATDDALQLLRITVNRAGDLIELGLLRECLEQVESALRLDETAGCPVLRACALTAGGCAHASLGEFEAAGHSFEVACDIFQGVGSRLLAWPLIGLGNLHRHRGELAHARAAYEEALALAEPHHDVLGLGKALMGLARVRAADDLATAREFADRAVDVCDDSAQVRALLTRGWVLLLSDEPELAAGDAARAADLARGRRHRPGLAEALELTAFVSADRSTVDALLHEATKIWKELGHPVEGAVAGMVAASLSGRDRGVAVSATEKLRRLGVRVNPPCAAGPLAAVTISAPTISIRALGVFRVFRNGVPVASSAWQSKMARDLLKILVAYRGPVPREALMELLWPDNPGAASKRLSVLLSTLRNVLGPPRHLSAEGPVVADRDVVWLDLDQVDLDVEEFIAVASAALDEHDKGTDQATAQLVAAEACYGGDFLADDPYQDWAVPLRDETRTLYTAVLRALLSELGDASQVDRFVRYALRLLNLEPYDEDTHLRLVRTLVEQGRCGQARSRYQEYARRMGELGVSPEPWPGSARGLPR